MKRIQDWNQALPPIMQTWLEKDRTSGKIISANRIISDILARPEQYGFRAQDPYTEGAGIWADHIHTTTRVQRIVADGIKEELQ